MRPFACLFMMFALFGCESGLDHHAVAYTLDQTDGQRLGELEAARLEAAYEPAIRQVEARLYVLDVRLDAMAPNRDARQAEVDALTGVPGSEEALAAALADLQAVEAFMADLQNERDVLAEVEQRLWDSLVELAWILLEYEPATPDALFEDPDAVQAFAHVDRIRTLLDACLEQLDELDAIAALDAEVATVLPTARDGVNHLHGTTAAMETAAADRFMRHFAIAIVGHLDPYRFLDPYTAEVAREGLVECRWSTLRFVDWLASQVPADTAFHAQVAQSLGV